MFHLDVPSSLAPKPVAVWRARLSRWGPVLLLMVAIFFASSLQDLPSPGAPDYVSHFAAYGVLSGLIVRALSRGPGLTVSWRTALQAIAFAGVYGVSDEFHQAFVPGRVADLGDIAADVAGATFVAGAVWAWSIISSGLRSS